MRVLPVALLIVSVLNHGSAFAQQSTLSQTLLAPDCAAATQCEMRAPTIDEIDKNNGRPIIRGTFDPVYTRYLRVIFGNKVYTLDTGGGLIRSGTKWELNLSGLLQPLTFGAYSLIVETEGFDGEKKQVSTIIIFTPEKDDGGIVIPPSSQPLDNIGVVPQPMSPLEARRRVSLIPFLLTVISSGVLFIVAVAFRRRNGED